MKKQKKKRNGITFRQMTNSEVRYLGASRSRPEGRADPATRRVAYSVPTALPIILHEVGHCVLNHETGMERLMLSDLAVLNREIEAWQWAWGRIGDKESVEKVVVRYLRTYDHDHHYTDQELLMRVRGEEIKREEQAA